MNVAGASLSGPQYRKSGEAHWRIDLRRSGMATVEEALQQILDFHKDAVRLGILCFPWKPRKTESNLTIGGRKDGYGANVVEVPQWTCGSG